MPVVFLVAHVAAAKCASGGLSVLSVGPIGVLDEIVVTARDGDRDALAADPIALVADGDVVPLVRVTALAGSFDSAQLVLRPSRPLAVGVAYVLRVGDRPVGDPLVVVEHPAAGPPAWNGSPQVLSRTRRELGCGPAVEVVVSVEVTDATSLEATVWPAEGGEPASARLPVVDGKVTIGHGMCSGPFALDQGRAYFADLVAVDARGRRADADDTPIRFVAP